MSEPKISLIVSTYNSPAALAKVFRGLAYQSRWPAEILKGVGPVAVEVIHPRGQPEVTADAFRAPRRDRGADAPALRARTPQRSVPTNRG